MARNLGEKEDVIKDLQAQKVLSDKANTQLSAKVAELTKVSIFAKNDFFFKII